MSELARFAKRNIKLHLLRLRISKNELSRRTGMSQSSVVQLLNNDREICTNTIQRIADAMNMKTRTLFLRIPGLNAK